MAFIDYMNQSTNSQQQQTGQQAQTQANTYNPAQQGLQSNLGGFYNTLLQGNIPSSFTNPAAPMQAYSANFDNMIMPGYAANFGPGSSAGNSAKALGMEQLQGQLYNTGVGNFMNALSGATNYSFNPIGGTGSGTTSGTAAGQGSNTTGINPLLMLLMGALGGIGGGISGLTGGP